MLENMLSVLKRGEKIVGDGAMGTTLHKLGLMAGTLPELWNIEKPQAIIAVHQDYLEVGAQFITCNTLNCNRPMMLESGLLDRRLELARAGARVAIQAAAGRAWVGASIGPTGQLLEPLGELTITELEADFREQVEVFAEEGVDFIKLETHQDIEEACAAVRMAKRYTSLPVWCTFAFNSRGRTLMGLRAADAAQRLESEGADIVGANCGDGPAAIEAALRAMRPVTSLPLAAQSNAGIPHLGEHGSTDWDVSPAELTEYIKSYITLGAQVFAGCCGTNPEFIRAINQAVHGKSE
ncbi:MAG: homocysteine S-methyltransferase family protein [Anaerolineae bacterium]